MRLLLLLLVFLSSLPDAFAQDSLWQDYRRVGNKDNVSVRILLQIAEHYTKAGLQSDSVYHLAIDRATLGDNDSLRVTVILHYFSEYRYGTPLAAEFSRQLVDIATYSNNYRWLYYSYRIIAQQHLHYSRYPEALEHAGKAFYYANQLAELPLQAEAMLLNGRCLEQTNRKIEAFRYYMDALYASETIRDARLSYKCYGELADFYIKINKYEKAKQHKRQQLRILLAAKPVDSVAVMQENILYAHILFMNGETRVAEDLLRRVIDYSRRIGQNELRQRAFSVYRTRLITEGEFRQLAHLYKIQYPDELQRTMQSDTTLYYRLMAFIMEAQNQNDSAALYYHLAQKRVENSEYEPHFQSNFYKRYGEFLIRQQLLPEAEAKLQRAYAYAEGVEYLPYLIDVSALLDSINIKLNRPTEAHRYARLHHYYSARLQTLATEDDLLRLEVDNETKKRELMLRQQEEATRRRHNIQYMGIVLGITISFVILAMLGSFKVPRWVIKAMGFFTFIFFFEFIILLADHKIHHATHGEPWKIMAIKVALIAVLLPLHHWLEEKAVHYLYHHKLIDTSKLGFSWKRKKKAPPKDTVVEEGTPI